MKTNNAPRFREVLCFPKSPSRYFAMSLYALHSRNPHGTALFCTVPPNQIFLRSVQNRPEPRLGHPNSRQRSGLRRSHVALLRRPMSQESPAIPHIPLNSTYALPPNPAPAGSTFPCPLPAFTVFTFVSPSIHDFHAKKISAPRCFRRLQSTFASQVPAIINSNRHSSVIPPGETPTAGTARLHKNTCFPRSRFVSHSCPFVVLFPIFFELARRRVAE